MKTIRETVPHIKPLIDERKEKMEEFGDTWEDKPVSTKNKDAGIHELKLAE